MTSPMTSAHHSGAYSTSDTRHSSGGTSTQGYAQNLGRRVKSFMNSLQGALKNPRTSGWNGVSGFFTAIYDRAVRAVNYASLYVDQMLPEYLTRAGACCICGFIIGALSPIGPLWGTASGLLLATGWQLCVECNTDRAISPEPRFRS